MNKLIIAALALLTGCTAPAIGDWKSKGSLGGNHDKMSLEDDQKGDAKIYFNSGDTLYYAEYDLEWEDDGDKVTIELETSDGSLDFDLDCEMNDDEDEMECDPDGAFGDFEFEWKRD
jgi:hypothetical protein